VANAVEHGRASRVIVDVTYAPARFELWVRDDGAGIDAPAAADRLPGRHGLAGMRERAERAGGTLQVESAPGVGTEIGVVIPRARLGARRKDPS
jgi:signal transduction histidine kinase